MNMSDLRIKLFADGADLPTMRELAKNLLIRGFTTNPTLMQAAGIRDYRAFAKDVLKAIPDRPISFEVFADDFTDMERQAREIATWGENVYVKIPITNTRQESSTPLISRLSSDGIKVNITAVLTDHQIQDSLAALPIGATAYLSIFAGRIADTGRDPAPLIKATVQQLDRWGELAPHVELIWASPRELLNIFQADAAGCHIITATPDLLKKLPLVGKDLTEYSLDTVRMFYNDAQRAGFTL